MSVERTETAIRWSERFPLARVSAGRAVAVTLAMVVAAWLARAGIDNQLPPGFPFVTFFPAVLLCSFLFGARMGILAAVLCGLIAWHQFTPPRGSFAIEWGGVVGMLFYVFITSTEILLVHWMQRANTRVITEREANARLAHTRELLFRELQHRISNNLQMVAGLVSLQRRQVADADARLALDEAARRLEVIGRISRKLYNTDGSGRAMGRFLDELAGEVVDASGRDGVTVSVTTEDDAPLAPDAAIPLALIVAEAVANSIEHGFEGQSHGDIAIRLRRPTADRVSVEVEDNGSGLPKNFDIDANPSLGLKIATQLARQIGGRFELASAGARGAVARLDLPSMA